MGSDSDGRTLLLPRAPAAGVGSHQPENLGVKLRRLVPLILLTALVCWHIRTIGNAFRSGYAYVQTLLVKYEMGTIRESLVMAWQARAPLPRPGDEFERFVRDSFHKSDRDPVVDRFGHHYAYDIDTGFLGRVKGFRLVSAGPDGRLHTGDDIVVAWKVPPEIGGTFTGLWGTPRGGRSAPR